MYHTSQLPSGWRRTVTPLTLSAHPDGFEEVFSKEELISALIELCNRNPQARRICIKLNHGVSGEGNISLYLSPSFSLACVSLIFLSPTRLHISALFPSLSSPSTKIPSSLSLSHFTLPLCRSPSFSLSSALVVISCQHFSLPASVAAIHC